MTAGGLCGPGTYGAGAKVRGPNTPFARLHTKSDLLTKPGGRGTWSPSQGARCGTKQTGIMARGKQQMMGELGISGV